MWVLYQYRRIQQGVTAALGEPVNTDPEGREGFHKISSAGSTEAANDRIYEIWRDDSVGWLDAHAWHPTTKWMATLIVSSISGVVAFATAIPASLVKPISYDFGTSKLIEMSATATFLFGFGIGALATGPFSETFGRNAVFIVTMGLMMIFLGIAGCADTLAHQVVFRFLAGFVGSSPLVCAGGSLSDLWTSEERIYVFPVFAVVSYGGSAVAPVVGGAISRDGGSWRWGDWITIIATGVLLAMVILFLPETFRPILLKAKTRVIQAHTQREQIHTLSINQQGKPSLWRQILQGLWRPFVLTAHEGIVILYTWYIALIYIILLTFLNGFNNIFSDIYGFDPVQTGLTFFSQLIGNCLCCLIIPIATKYYRRDLNNTRGRGRQYNDDKANGQKSNRESQSSEEPDYAEDVDVDALTPPPESQLYYAMIGAPFIPVALFWMAYTSRADISPWSPIMASLFFGFGFTNVFVSCYQYLTACYGIWSASALAAVNCLRALLSGAMMMASMAMYSNIGVMWSLTVLGIASAIMVPVPYAFYTWGHKIRQWSRHAYKGGV